MDDGGLAAVGPRQGAEEQRRRLVEPDDDGLSDRALRRRSIFAMPLPVEFRQAAPLRRRIELALPRPDHVVGGHGRAVVELDAVAQMEGVGLAVLAKSPSFPPASGRPRCLRGRRPGLRPHVAITPSVLPSRLVPGSVERMSALKRTRSAPPAAQRRCGRSQADAKRQAGGDRRSMNAAMPCRAHHTPSAIACGSPLVRAACVHVER